MTPIKNKSVIDKKLLKNYAVHLGLLAVILAVATAGLILKDRHLVNADGSNAGQYFSPGSQGVAERANSDVQDLDYSQDFSVEALLRIPTFEEEARMPAYICKKYRSEGGWCMFGGHDYFKTYTHGLSMSVSDGVNGASIFLNESGLTHVVLSWDAASKTLTGYINGRSQQTNTNANINLAGVKNTQPLKLAGNLYYNGAVTNWGTSNTDVYFARLWNRKLSDADISGIYANWQTTGRHQLPNGFDRSGLVSEWLMDATSDKTGAEGATYIKDDVGGNHLEIKGTAFMQKESGALGIVSPANGASGIGPSSFLDVSGGADSLNNAVMPVQYYFQVDESPSFSSSNLKESGWQAESEWQPTLKPSTTYYWRVKIKDSADSPQETSYSSATSFSTRASKNWYVRPFSAVGSYGQENGSNYANAFNGLTKLNYSEPSSNNTHGVVWGPGGVESGDTLYICGSHSIIHQQVLNMGNVGRAIIAVNGYSDQYPVTIRTDAPEQAGIVWGFSKPSAVISWSGPDANGVYSAATLLSGPLATDLDSDNPKILLKETSASWTGHNGYWFKDSGHTYIKMSDGGNPAGRVYAYGSGYILEATHRQYIKFQNCDFRGYHFADQRTDVGPSSRSTHITWDNCTLQYGSPLIEIGRDNHYWTVRNSVLKNAGSAVYAINNKEGRTGDYVLIENNRISNLGLYENSFSDGDNHAVGIQGGSNWIIQNNYIENTGSAIEFWNGVRADARMINNTIRWNFIKNVYHCSNTVGNGIVLSGDNGPSLGQRTGYKIYGNIIYNMEGHGISSNNPDPKDIYNNTIVDYGHLTDPALFGDPPADGHGIRESVTSSYPLSITSKNNIIVNNVRRNTNDINRQYFINLFSHFSQSMDAVHIDNNIYYPNANVGAEFSAGDAGHTTFNNYRAKTGFDQNGFAADPLLVQSTAVTEPENAKLLWNSPAIDSGADMGVTKDFFGNPIYGMPDIGAVEFQPPYVMGTNKPDIGANVRIYGDGKFRNKISPSGSVADISISPQNSNTSKWLDLTISQWNKAGDYKKTWTEDSPNIGSGRTGHVIGDLAPNGFYDVYYTKVGEARTKLANLQANALGKISFDYDKGYSNVVFEIETGADAPLTLSNGLPSGALSSNTTQASLSLSTNKAATCKYATTANTSYNSMSKTFSFTGNITHSNQLTGLSSAGSYKYYVKCKDQAGNINSSDYLISFSVNNNQGNQTPNQNNANGNNSSNSSSDSSGQSGDTNKTATTTNKSASSTTNKTTVNSKTDAKKIQNQQTENKDYAKYSSLYGQTTSVVEQVSNSEAGTTAGNKIFVNLDKITKKVYEDLMSKVKKVVKVDVKYAIAYFIHHGTPTTKRLGSGERAGVIASFISAFNRMPELVSDWQDIIKIANGRWPSQKNSQAEASAKEEFKKIYKREPDLNNAVDKNAIIIIAYGIRPVNRNVSTEKSAIGIYKLIFQHNPVSAREWDIIRAIGYGGAKR